MKDRVILTVNLSHYNTNGNVLETFLPRYNRAVTITNTENDDAREAKANVEPDITVIDGEMGIEIRFIGHSDSSVVEQILDVLDDEDHLFGVTYDGNAQDIIDALKSQRRYGHDGVDFRIGGILINSFLSATTQSSTEIKITNTESGNDSMDVDAEPSNNTAGATAISSGYQSSASASSSLIPPAGYSFHAPAPPLVLPAVQTPQVHQLPQSVNLDQLLNPEQLNKDSELKLKP